MSVLDGLAPVDRWDESEADALAGLDLLVYQSRLLGADPRLVVWGGGNTSLKLVEPDYQGRSTCVLRVKGSGADLKVVTARDFPGVRLDDVLPLLDYGDMNDEDMVAYLAHTLMEPSSPRPSIETLLHAFIPARSVVHSHADAILALTNNERREELLAAVFGDELAVIPYHRPGFLLSRQVGEVARDRPAISGAILTNHGLITWHDDPRKAYGIHIEMAKRAAEYVARASRPVSSGAPDGARDPGRRREAAARLAPALRGLLSKLDGRVVLRFGDSEDVLRLTSGRSFPPDRLWRAFEAGAATPDHIFHAGRVPLRVEPDDPFDADRVPEAARRAVDEYVRRYAESFATYGMDQEMLPPAPRVVLVAGLGMYAVGKDSHAAAVAGEITRHTIAIVEAAETVGRYHSLSASDAFAAEYWPLERYKLTLSPPEKELSRRVALVTGAAGAIGAGIARRFAAEGAHVVCADLDLRGATALAERLTSAHPANRALAVEMDVTDESSVRRAYERLLLEYGGVDTVVSNAGIAHNAPLDALEFEDWQRSFAVNSTGHFLVAREALRVMKAQGTGGSFVFIATKNVPAPGKDFGAYSASKAAQAQLARVLALEGGAWGVRSNIVNPDAVFAGSGLWSGPVREERARSHGIPPSELEEFYRTRNLLRTEVTADDVAEAALFYASDRSAKTTGSMLPVDGGLREAFPR